MNDPVISIKKVSKAYRIWNKPSARLSSSFIHSISRFLPQNSETRTRLETRAGRDYHDFWALRDVSLEVHRGESVGIIGRNGSGKSTLLQIISGTLQPTSGSTAIWGRVAALLELGAGFNADFTGRENVFLSGAVLGLSASDIEARFDQIAAFADIGDFIEQPVKTYSSGMLMRLAFAVNTSIDPEIMIIDEALSVGDAPFQAKCFARLNRLIEGGVTLLFVSHDVGTVRSICSRAIWLDHGTVRLAGDAQFVSREYEKFCWAEQGVRFTENEASAPVQIANESANASPLTSTEALVPKGESRQQPRAEPPPSLFSANPEFEKLASTDRYGTQAIKIANLLVTNANHEPVQSVNYGETLYLHFLLNVQSNVDSDVIVGVRIKDTRGVFIMSAQDIWNTHRISATAGRRFYACVAVPTPLTHSDFVLMTAIFGFLDGRARADGPYDFGRAILWDVIESAAYFRVNQFNDFPLCGPVHHHAESTFALLP